jgi:sugar/nucleoside kinase (ribokinase family)
MPLLVVGSVAFDCVETPTDRRDDVLGGSAVFFSYAASFFSPVRMIGAVGEDWPAEHTSMLENKGIDIGTSGNSRREDIPMARSIPSEHE